MDEYEKDLPIVRAVVEKLSTKFPDYYFLIDWVPEVEEFFIRVNDSDISETDEYRQCVRTLETKLFDQTYCRVIFSGLSFDPANHTGEYETIIPSPSELLSKEGEPLVHSAN